MKRDPLMTVFDVPRIGCEILSLFDWITPLFKEAQTIKHDPTTLNSWTFFIPNTKAIHAGWSQSDIKRLLEAEGIEIYGDYVSFGELSFHVSISQAGRTEDILNKNTVPIKPRSQGAPRR